jgi:sugar phosphate isomerase/epimerase
MVPPACLSLCWLTVRGAHPFDHIQAALAGGFNAVGLRLVPPTHGDPMVPVVGDEPLVRELLARLVGNQLRVLDVETVWIGSDIDVVALRPVLELAQRLGCGNLLTMGNDRDEERLTDSFGLLCEEAARFGVSVGMEFSAYSAVPTIQHAERLVRAAAQPNGKILVDALHLARSGGTPADVAALDPRFLAYCQLADARGPRPSNDSALVTEARAGRELPGAGELPLVDLLRAMPAGLPLGVEAPCQAHAGCSVVERGRLAGVAIAELLGSLGVGPMPKVAKPG